MSLERGREKNLIQENRKKKIHHGKYERKRKEEKKNIWIKKEKNVERKESFIEFTFPELQRQIRIVDFQIRYKDSSFTDNTEIIKLGGQDRELGHTHIDFLRRGDDWVIDKIWQCR